MRYLFLFLASMCLSAEAVHAVTTDTDEGWNIVVSPLYLWGKSLEGVSAVGGNEAPLDLDFRDDILENLDAAFSLRLEAVKDRLAYYTEINYGRLEPGSTGRLGPVEIDVDVKYDDIIAETGVAWSLNETGKSRWELLAAARYYKQDLKIDFSGETSQGGSSPGRQVSAGDSWWNGIAGVRFTHHLSDRWGLRLRADVGYGGDSNSSQQGIAWVNYRFNEWGSAFFGYRYISVDYDNEHSGPSGFKYDVDQQGPLLGLNFHF